MGDPLVLLLIGLIVVLGCILILKLNPFLALLAGGLIVGALTPRESLEAYALGSGMDAQAAAEFASKSVGTRVADGFGATCASIGILIAMASIIGICLIESGAAEKIVRSALGILGEQFAGLAFLICSFVLAIPIFFDTVFYLMIPLAKSAASRTGRNFVLLVLSIIAGGTMAHSLVPPTPGPLFVAAELGVDMSVMILGGLVVGIITSGSGFLYALWANKRWPLPVRSTPDISAEELSAMSLREESTLPSFTWSLLPIVLPLALIAVAAFFETRDQTQLSTFGKAMMALGDKNIALILSAVVALVVMALQLKRTGSSTKIGAAVQKGLLSAGLIIMITSAGGAFGQVLKQTGISMRVEGLAAHYSLAVIPLAFFVTMVMRTAQGSATVAMVTAIGIVGGMADADLGFHPVYLALAIGCGSKPINWMNDSAFWIISRMTGWSEIETLKLASVTISLMGFVGLPVVMILAALFPFA